MILHSRILSQKFLVTLVANLTESNCRVSLNSRRYNLVLNPANMLDNSARNYPYAITKLLQISWNHKGKRSREEELDFTLIYTSMFLIAKVLGNDNGHSKSVHFCLSVLVDYKKWPQILSSLICMTVRYYISAPSTKK